MCHCRGEEGAANVFQVGGLAFAAVSRFLGQAAGEHVQQKGVQLLHYTAVHNALADGLLKLSSCGQPQLKQGEVKGQGSEVGSQCVSYLVVAPSHHH